MARYDQKILHGLLDSYEKSLLFSGKNKNHIQISYPFTVTAIPEYFDESSLAYEELHIRLRELEKRGFIRIIWKRPNQIIQKLVLEENRIPELYCFLNRIPKMASIEKTLALLGELEQNSDAPICRRFIAWLKHRIQSDQPVKEYIDLGQQEQTAQLLRALAAIENNRNGCYIREFSIRHFGDSKILEGMLGLLGKIMRRFGMQFEDMDIYAILAEYSIYHTPNYIYMKGDSGVVYLNGSSIELGGLKQGIGISGEDIESMRIDDAQRIKKVITIENLTTFFSWQEAESILIYLGGYHNSVRRRLLILLHSQISQAEYLHFGDIDAGGFEIYEDLCRKTGILFQPYYMNVETLEIYSDYTKKLTQNDRKRIEELRKRNKDGVYLDVLDFMLAADVKLEQECIDTQRKYRLV